MSEESNDALDAAELDAAEIVAAELISRIKALRVSEIDLSIIDESYMWVVTVRRLGILADESAAHTP